MRIHTGFTITYDCPAPVPMLLMLSVHPSRRGDLETFDGLRTDPVVDVHHYLDGYGKKVKGTAPHPHYDMCDQRIAEKGWFA